MVNIKDMDSDKVTEDRLEEIFKRQSELMEEYEEIEKENELLHTEDVPVDLHDRFGQARLKDFAWRVTEELGEALEALTIHDDPMHYNEELSDALHFLVEMTILAGYEPEDLTVTEEGNDCLEALYIGATRQMVEGGPHKNEFIDAILNNEARKKYILTYTTGRVIESLGVTCNYLKNKPWKQSHMLTDVNRFEEALVNTWHRFIELAAAANISSQGLTDLYFGKADVNQWRMDSNY